MNQEAIPNNENRGLQQLCDDIDVIQANKPSWLINIENVMLPRFQCDAEEPLSWDEVKPLTSNTLNDTRQQARVRARVKLPHFPRDLQHHTLRLELDVDLNAYPDTFPQIWVRTATAIPAVPKNDGAFHPHIALYFFEAIEQHSHRERNVIETTLWFFVHRYLTHEPPKDKMWPNEFTIPPEYYEQIVKDWRNADALLRANPKKTFSDWDNISNSLSQWLDPSVSGWLSEQRPSEVGEPPAKGRGRPESEVDPPPFAQEITPNVHCFPLFTEQFCLEVVEAFLAEKSYADQNAIPIQRPNNMNKSGAIMTALGLETLMEVLQDRVFQPISQKLFPKTGSELTNHHSFLVHYTSGEDLGLDMHTDDSDVTFNCCLGRDFKGAALQICGIIGEPDHRQSKLQYLHKPGWVICHLGRQRHGANDIESGERINLISWNYSKVWRRCANNLKRPYSPEQGRPDPQCLSFTHDRDWEKYKGERPYETGVKPWCPPKHAEYIGEAESPYPVGD